MLKANIGSTDRWIRIIAGVVLLAYAIPVGFPVTGWNWVGWIGFIPLITAVVRICPAYLIFGATTCPTQKTG